MFWEIEGRESHRVGTENSILLKFTKVKISDWALIKSI